MISRFNILMPTFSTIVNALKGMLTGAFEGHRDKQPRVKHSIVRGLQKQNIQKKQIQHNKIKKLDIYFSEAFIKSRVEQAFFIIKHAYSSHNIRPATAFISDGLAESMQILFQIQKHRQRQRKIENLNLRLVSWWVLKPINTLKRCTLNSTQVPVIRCLITVPAPLTQQ